MDVLMLLMMTVHAHVNTRIIITQQYALALDARLSCYI